MEESAPAGPRVARWIVELAVAALLLALGVVMIVSNARVGAGWSEDGPQSGYFPLRMGVLLALCSVGIAVQALRMPKEQIFVRWDQLKPVLQVSGPMLVYVALIQVLGMYVASALFIAAFMKAIGKYPVWKSVLTGVLSSALLFWVFENQVLGPDAQGAAGGPLRLLVHRRPMVNLAHLVQGFAVALTWYNLGLMLVGILLGIVVGVLPGLGGPTRWPSSCR